MMKKFIITILIIKIISIKNILGILLIATTLFYSCDKTRIAGRQFKNSTWKITKIEVLPISNEFGPINVL